LLSIPSLIGKIAFLDGSLRDIYIFNKSLQDWDVLLDFLKSNYPLEFEQDRLPDTIHHIINLGECDGRLLKINIGNDIFAHCHFYVSEKGFSPIEFDLDPKELQSTYAIETLLQFMQNLGEALKEDVVLTEENSETHILLSYSFSSKNFSIT
jgi:hypothetical protein